MYLTLDISNSKIMLNQMSLKYQKFTPSGCKDIGNLNYYKICISGKSTGQRLIFRQVKKNLSLSK